MCRVEVPVLRLSPESGVIALRISQADYGGELADVVGRVLKNMHSKVTE